MRQVELVSVLFQTLVTPASVCLTPCCSDAQPTEGEREIWNQISAVLQDSESILTDLQAYKGAGPEIRDVRRGDAELRQPGGEGKTHAH